MLIRSIVKKNWNLEILEMKIACYTCITGGKNVYTEPIFMDNEIDYYMLSDEDIKLKKCELIKIDEEHEDIFNAVKNVTRYGKERKQAVNHLISQKYRILPFTNKELSKYDITIWHDGSMIIKDTLMDYVDVVMSNGSYVGLIQHPQRSCVYTELKFWKKIKKGFPIINQKALDRFLQEHFPYNYSLWAGGLHIFFHNKEINKYYRLLFNDILKYTFADQLSFPYWLWRYGIPYTTIGCQCDNLYMSKITQKGHKWRQTYES